MQARDFDPNSLRYELPKIVSVIDRCISEGSKVYVHCTAGLGRAPGAAIAYLYWFRDMDVSFGSVPPVSLRMLDFTHFLFTLRRASLQAMMRTGLKMRLGCQITDRMLWAHFMTLSAVSSRAVHGL